MTYDKIEEIVYSFPTKHKEGYTREEITGLLKEKFPKITREQLAKKIGTVTGIIIAGDLLIYQSDIINALLCVVENREQSSFEFD